MGKKRRLSSRVSHVIGAVCALGLSTLHGRHFTIFDGRRVNEKGLLVEDFSTHVTKSEKSRPKLPQKDMFCEAFLPFVTCGRKVNRE